MIDIALAIMIDFRFIPANRDFSNSAFSVIGVFLGTLILWLTISIGYVYWY